MRFVSYLSCGIIIVLALRQLNYRHSHVESSHFSQTAAEFFRHLIMKSLKTAPIRQRPLDFETNQHYNSISQISCIFWGVQFGIFQFFFSRFLVSEILMGEEASKWVESTSTTLPVVVDLQVHF